MYDIVASKKVQEGIVVMWNDGGAIKYDTINFQDLIDMKVNVLDLLDRPVAYRIDTKAHKVVPKV